MEQRGGKAQGSGAELHKGHRKRMRAAYIQGGADGMHDHQLLELLLSYGLPRVDTNALAHRLLSRQCFGSLEAVLGADVEQLKNTPGLGEHTAVLISMVGELGRRVDIRRYRGSRLNSPERAMAFCIALTRDEKDESAYMLSLDRAMRVLHVDKLGAGVPGEVTIYPRRVAELALRYGAENVILCHNHPAGSLTPSRADCETTNIINDALRHIGITLNDHIITGGGGAYSMLRDTMEPVGELNVTGRQAPAAAAERKE